MSKMTVRQCMDASLQLINQYSITGTVIPLSYNGQADTELRLINLINDAQMQIAVTSKPIDAYFSVDVPEPEQNSIPGEIEYVLADHSITDMNHPIAVFFKPASGGVLRTVDANRYKWIGEDILILPDRPAGTYRIQYNRYPKRYDSTTDVDTTYLDNTPDTHEIIPYFVASMLAHDENKATYYALYNVWETRLARLGEKNAHAVITDVADVYGFGSGGIY